MAPPTATQAFLPHYDGETDPLTWLNKCDLYFRGASIMDEEKVWTATLHLDGTAALVFPARAGAWPCFLGTVC